jgi:hypothetical protein
MKLVLEFFHNETSNEFGRFLYLNACIVCSPVVNIKLSLNFFNAYAWFEFIFRMHIYVQLSKK